MSKKKEMEAFKEGMVAGAQPFEEKFNQHAKFLNNIQRSIKHKSDCIQNDVDSLIDIAQEHDDRLNQIQYPELYDISKLEEEEKNVIFSFLIEIVEEYGMNDYQKQMIELLAKYFEKDLDSIDAEPDDIDEIETVKKQKIIYRTVYEFMAINFQTECVETYRDYFSLSPRAKAKIEDYVKEIIEESGEEGIIEIYDQEILKKPKRKYPVLKIETKIEDYELEEWEVDMWFEPDMDIGEKIFRKENECRDAYAYLLWPYITKRNSFIERESNNYVGNKIVEKFGKVIESDINKILDYVNVNKFNIDIQDLLDMRDNYKEKICDFFDYKVKSASDIYQFKSFSYYKDKLDIDKDTDYVETLFGDFKEVTVYVESFDGYDCYQAVEDMKKELLSMVNYASSDIYFFVKDNYIQRFEQIVEQINSYLDN